MNRFMIRLARASALLGGMVLIVLMILLSLSILMRGLGLGEIKGVYEILEAGVGFAIFAFFPICQLYGEHATVDVFTMGLSDRINRILRAIWEVALSAAIIFITLRLYAGMERYLGNGETTLFLQFPVWWSYAACVFGASIACVIAIYVAALRVAESASGRVLLPTS